MPGRMRRVSSSDPLEEQRHARAMHDAELRRISATLLRVIRSTDDENLRMTAEAVRALLAALQAPGARGFDPPPDVGT
jgi:hypothetical protein